MDLKGFTENLKDFESRRSMGKIEKIIGMTVEASGPQCNIGDVCRVYKKGNPEDFILAEAVGFQEDKVLLMPYTDIEGIGPGSIVENTGKQLMVRTCNSLIGRIVDAIGRPLDNGGEKNTRAKCPFRESR